MKPSAETEAPAPFAGDPPVELLDWIVDGDKGQQTLATTEMFLRYREALHKKLKKRLFQYDDDFLADFVIQTFTIVFQNPEKFERKTNEDSEIQEKRFIKWMTVIANNLYNSWIREQANLSTMSDEFWTLTAEHTSQSDFDLEEPSSEKARLVREAMDVLSERDREILRIFLSHCPDITNRQSKLPRNVIAELCDHFNTTPENIRAIRSRAIKKVKAHLEEKGISL